MTSEHPGASASVEPVAAAAATPNEQLFAALYSELRDLAQRQLRHTAAHRSVQPRCFTRHISGCRDEMPYFRIVLDSWDTRRE
jgi:hypothetical protein